LPVHGCEGEKEEMLHILVATGGSAHSDTAVTMGARLAHLVDGRVTLLTVIRREADRSQGEAILQRARQRLLPEVAGVNARIRQGQPSAEIIREAVEGQADLIVIGERTLHGFVARLLGPTVERVMSHAPCPVLLARADTGRLEKLLVCEGGREPLLLDRLANKLPQLLMAGVQVTVLHVMSQIAAAPGVSGWALNATAEELIATRNFEGRILEKDMTLLAPRTVKTKVRHGMVVEEVVAEAEQGGYDLLVIGAHRVSGWERFLLDDLTQQIVAESKQAVLIV